MREYQPKDFQTVKQWSEHYGLELYQELIPPMGLIDDNVYCSLYFAVGANVLFIDNFIANPATKPIALKNSIKSIERILRKLLEYKEGVWSVRITALSQFGGILERLGGIVDPRPYSQILFFV